MSELGKIENSANTELSEMDSLEFSSYIRQGFKEILKVKSIKGMNRIYLNVLIKYNLLLKQSESLLNDLDSEVSLLELKNILSLEYGESMCVFIRRADNQVISNYDILFQKDAKQNLKLLN